MRHDIAWYRKEHRLWHSDRKLLEAALDGFQTAAARTLEATVKAARIDVQGEYLGKLEDALKAFDQSDVLLRKYAAIDEEQRAFIGELQTDLQISEHRCAVLEDQLEASRRELEASQPALDHAEGQVRDLTALLTKLEDRMKRKDLEEQQAILNREVLSHAIPGRRRV